MNKTKITLEEIEKRFAEIDKQEPEALSLTEKRRLDKASLIDDGVTISLEDYKKRKEYNGKILLRVPKELHEELAQKAADNGVSLNQYALYKLSK